MNANRWLPVIVWAVAAVLFVGSVFILGQQLPARVATHFDGAGNPNGWMRREQHIWFFSIFGVAMTVLVCGSTYLLRFFPASMLNVPKADYWRSPAHYPEACAIVFRHTFWFGAWTLVWLGSVNGSIVAANQLPKPKLDPHQLFVSAAVYLVGLGIWIWRMMVRFKRVSES